MSPKRRLRSAVATVLTYVAVAICASTAHAQGDTPNDWLNRMAAAVQTTSYEGTVLRLHDGAYEALKVVHTVADGVVRERVLVQEGNGLEIIRNGNEVHCILPDQNSVLVEEWNDQSTLFSSLPSTDVQFGNEYDLSIDREDRIAGRKAALLSIRPHDSFRFGHRIWLDVATGFPLQSQLVSDDGTTIEEVRFADISLNKEIHANALAPSYNTENFRWFTQSERKRPQVVESTWTNDNLPAGFRLVSTQLEELPGSDAPVMHMMYSDGLAQVSVFVAASEGKNVAQRSSVGASNSFSVEIANFQVTAVGEVPAAAVEQIAESMRPR